MRPLVTIQEVRNFYAGLDDADRARFKEKFVSAVCSRTGHEGFHVSKAQDEVAGRADLVVACDSAIRDAMLAVGGDA